MSPDIDLQRYRIKEDRDPVFQQSEVDFEPSQPLSLDDFKIQVDETTGQRIGRGAARTISRGLEAILGFPGDLARLGKAAEQKVKKITGAPEDEKDDIFTRAIEKGIMALPTSQEIRGLTNWLTSGYTEPQTAKEQFGDEITELASLLAMPSRDPVKLKKLFSAVGKATAAKGAGKTAEAFGAGEKGQLAAELGTLFVMGLHGKSAPDQLVRDKYNKSIELLPEGTIANTKNLSKDLKSIRKELSKGISTPTKNEVINTINELDAKAATGAMEAEELLQSFRDLNERMTSKGLFDEVSKSQRKLLKFRFGKVKDAVNKSVNELGESNPEFFKEWKEANKTFGVLEQSKQAQNFINNKLPSLPSKLATGLAIELFTAGVVPTAKTAGLLGATAGVHKAGQIMFRVMNDKSLAKHYAEALGAAAKSDSAAFIKSLNKLETELQKKEKENPIQLEEFKVQ